MANEHTTLTSLFSDIADSIRGKTGESGTIVANDFPSAIDAIELGVDTSDATATAATIRSGYTAYAKGSKITGRLQNYTGSTTITSNGTVSVGGKYCPSNLTVNVPIGIQPLVANESSISVSGGYYDSQYGVKIGYMSNGDIILTMKGAASGFNTGYFTFREDSVPSGVSIINNSASGTRTSSMPPAGVIFGCVISGVENRCNISVRVSFNATTVTCFCDLTIVYV